MKIDELEIKKMVLNDYQFAKRAKEPINKRIAKWLDVYNGKKYGNEQSARSQVVVRDVYKTIEALKPNLTEPFVGSNKPIDGIPYTPAGDAAALSSEKALNYQFTTQLDRRTFMNELVTVLAREGTVWVKNEWKYEDEEFRVPMTIPRHMLRLVEQEYEIKQENPDGTLDIEIIQVDIKKNEPNLRICRNEHIFTDPTAESDDDIQFIIHQYDTTISDLKKTGLYKNLDKLEEKRQNKLHDTSLGSLRDADAIEQGRYTAEYRSSDNNKSKITIMEYWGLFDIEKSGELEQCLIVWDKQTETIIRMEKNPTPDGEIPFERAVYIEEPFTLWGKALADAMDDGQKIHTAFMRGFIDNAALANNGQKFIMKGSIDQQNFRRMVNGEKHIYVNQNPNETITDGSYNQIPQTVFNLYEMVETQNEGITGISRINQGLDASSMAQTATGVSTLTSMSQRRMLDSVRNVSNLLRKVLRRQLRYSLFFIDDEEWFRITGMEKPQGKLGKDFDIKIDLITDAMKQTKISQFNLMLQNMQYITDEGVQFEVGNAILAKYFELFDEPELAERVKNQQPPQPDPMQIEQMQLEMAKLQAEIQKLQAEAGKTMAEAQTVGSEGEIKMLEVQAKAAESEIAIAEAEAKIGISEKKGMIDAAVKERKAAVDMMIKQEEAENKMAIQARESAVKLELERMKTAADVKAKEAMANKQEPVKK